jgi:hypothetical protein
MTKIIGPDVGPSIAFYVPRGGGRFGAQFDRGEMGWCLSAGVRDLFGVALLWVRRGA